MKRSLKRRQIIAFWALIAAIAANLVSPVLAAMPQAGRGTLERVAICSPDGPKTVVLDLGSAEPEPISGDAAHCAACPLCPSSQMPAFPDVARDEPSALGSTVGTALAWAANPSDANWDRRFTHPFESRAPPTIG